ncbi:hypothetical protein [Kurthia sibirica]|uniref:hypothetical protein n=1 Tax=Kurthia sibirica TaxID=202750 RepID=UPI0011BEF4F8|nr:hypothetical protein [Kurthia sibirica]
MNTDIRKAIEDSGLKYYQVAHAYGLTDSNFSRLLRFELPKEKRERVLEAIKTAKKTLFSR